ncbi:hypothetical protein H4Q26_007608 [Puccinia striiformis f. sp. tritici PST-130]|nr:hypothetical protein H4Q26_007608 [Puccinia striiformis f. sp. tritici PST-130]
MLSINYLLLVLSSVVLLAHSNDSLPPSSPRKSINYGPELSTHSIKTSVYSNHNHNDQFQASLTRHLPQTDSSSLKQFGIKIATEFLHHLHPSDSLTFQLTSAHISKHTKVLHAYFVQTIPLGDLDYHVKVHNAVANLNLNLDPRSANFGHVLSHSDSFHPIVEHPSSSEAVNFINAFDGQQGDRCTHLKNKFDGVLRSLSTNNQLLNQQVMGLFSTKSSQDSAGDEKTLLTDFSEEELRIIAECEISCRVDRYRQENSSSSSFYAAGDSDGSATKESPTFELFNVPGALGSDSLDGSSSTKATSAELAWLSVDDGERELKMVWRFEYRSNSNWYEAYVDASSPGLVPMVIDWVNDFRPTSELADSYSEHVAIQTAIVEEFKRLPTTPSRPPQSCSVSVRGATDEKRTATYRVFPWSVNDPTLGKRQIVVTPSNPTPRHLAGIPSPQPSVTVNSVTSVTCQPVGLVMSRVMDFELPILVETMSMHKKTGRVRQLGSQPSTKRELFFTCNEFHDLTYLYGFDEESGNFQQHNFGHGGKGDDAVIANAQDGSGYNNANFATPPDGRNGRMRMYVWNGAEPWRDGDLEAGIVIHEYSHGVSIRLTGGPANSGCLGYGESGGMGEGWGDFFATLIRMHQSKPVDFTMGEWASGVKGGIRKYKELIAKHGFQPSLFPPSGEADEEGFYKVSKLSDKKVPKHGNTLIFQLVLDGMKIQRCRPGFFDARDAILEADSILTGGENQCEIWKGFSKRGLGPKAAIKGNTPWGGGIRTNDFSLPTGVPRVHYYKPRIE